MLCLRQISMCCLEPVWGWPHLLLSSSGGWPGLSFAVPFCRKAKLQHICCPLYTLHPQERSLLLLICPNNSLLFSWADSCLFTLHAKEGEITSFTTPGFPHSPYPNNARCYWTLRADANSIISLTFKTLDLEQCTDSGDYIKVYNSLSPVEPHALVR